ncbi:hypothetical protein GGU11DRAFT_828778, partial [Lentinula aff. detonsa]
MPTRPEGRVLLLLTEPGTRTLLPETVCPLVGRGTSPFAGTTPTDGADGRSAESVACKRFKPFVRAISSAGPDCPSAELETPSRFEGPLADEPSADPKTESPLEATEPELAFELVSAKWFKVPKRFPESRFPALDATPKALARRVAMEEAAEEMTEGSHADGSEVILENLKKGQSHQSSPSIVTSLPTPSPSGLNSPARRAIRIVAPDNKKLEDKEREESQAKAAAVEKERKAKEDERLRKKKEDLERKEKEQAERKAKEEAERKSKDEADRQAKEEAERKAREEAEQKAKEEEEERQRLKAEEEEKKRIAEEERLREEKLKLEAEKQRREQEERRKEEEQMRLLKEEEEAAAAAKIKVEQEAEAQVEEQEEGEVLEPLIQQSDEKAAETNPDEQKPLRIDTAAPSEPLPKRRPG